MKTLIIDDDLFLKKALSFNLLELGHAVTLAGDGQEAIDLIKTTKNFDLIFCDMMMPVLSGPEFLLLLKTHFPEKLPCIVIISGVKDGEEFLKTIDIHYDYFVKKPVDMPALRKLIEEIDNSKNS